MSKLIMVNNVSAPAGARRIIRTPGVSGYASRMLPNHLDFPDEHVVSSINSVGGSNPITWAFNSPPAQLALKSENGIRHLESKGEIAAGQRLLGPHTEQRPVTFAAVVRAPASSSGFLGGTGVYFGRDDAGQYSFTGVGTPIIRLPYTKNGWVFLLATMGVTSGADRPWVVRADTVEMAGRNSLNPTPTYGGFYFGASSKSTTHLREFVIWNFEMNLAQRDSVHAYMRQRYPELS